ncbi:50S ribosomal protein L29 [Candidatus Woesebacteria bacterium RBG_19FT_COMBO_42_9]|nr:MAG: 50S ribosomal protein L29 [Candidatus Woesebacteria bacterium RBG_19FT_COMBO_42_9]
MIAEVYGGKEKNLKKAKNLRREIAQILTILREREILDVEAKKE